MITDVFKLDETCSYCSGAGEVPNSDLMEWNRQFQAEVKRFEYEGLPYHEAMNAAEKSFEKQGLEIRFDETDHYQCYECEGRGSVLTDEGMKLIRFLRKYL